MKITDIRTRLPTYAAQCDCDSQYVMLVCERDHAPLSAHCGVCGYQLPVIWRWMTDTERREKPMDANG